MKNNIHGGGFLRDWMIEMKTAIFRNINDPFIHSSNQNTGIDNPGGRVLLVVSV